MDSFEYDNGPRPETFYNQRMSFAGLLLLLAASPQEARDVQADTWAVVDGLGRRLPGFDECGPPRPGRTVGIFYFLWVNQSFTNRGNAPVHDISRILGDNPEKPAWGPLHAFHFWGEPELGYYTVDDEYVIRRHLELLDDAGVDVWIFDVTNAITYPQQYLKICEVFQAVRRDGGRAPQFCFILNSNAADTLKRLHAEFYGKNLHPELWFRWLGKPLLLAPPEAVGEDLKSFYTVRHSWAWSDRKGWFQDGRDKWCWVDHYPQKPGWHESPAKPEQISVCVAQHPTSNIGRSFHDGRQPPPDQFKTPEGLCFAEQWRRALEVDPPFVFVTGWNEWVAQRFEAGDKARPNMLGRPLKKGDTFFVDQYNEEYSRDIEPMKGGFGDAYYYQLVAAVRRYKGVRPPGVPRPGRVAVDGSFADWDAVGPEYRDHAGDVLHRDSHGWNKSLRYENRTGRNDFVRLKVSYDDRSVCFYAETARPVTPRTDPRWMLLFIDADQDPSTGWCGYDVLVDGGVKRWSGGKWAAAGEAPCRVAGSRLELAVPRAALRLEGKPVRIDFHWADNLQKDGDLLEFALSGDSAPTRRANYRYDSTLTQSKIDAWAKEAEKKRLPPPKK